MCYATAFQRSCVTVMFSVVSLILFRVEERVLVQSSVPNSHICTGSDPATSPAFPPEACSNVFNLDLTVKVLPPLPPHPDMFKLVKLDWGKAGFCYRPQGKIMFSQASVILSTINLIATRSLLILVTARSVRVLLEYFLVHYKVKKNGRLAFDVNAFYLLLPSATKLRRYVFTRLLLRTVRILLECILVVLAAQEKINSTTSVVIVFSYMRSGSTFIGELFKQNDDVFYIYEPLHLGHR